jgi:NAD+ kinase
MTRIAIVHNNNNESLIVVSIIKKLLDTHQFVIDQKYPEVVITVGGDGTLISAFHQYEDQVDTIRFIGVHTGHLGFYTDWRNYDVDRMIEALKLRQAEATSYPLLEVKLIKENGVETFLALNEAVVKRVSKTLVTNIYIKDELFENFRGDGLCISTPTGSTGYNKSLGGAVIHPQLRALQMTEIASINNRVFRTLSAPIVIAPDEWITIKPGKQQNFVIIIDGKKIAAKDVKGVQCRIADKSIRFDKFGHHHFWSRVQASFIGNENDEDF